jgi:hypothetical protein
LRIACDSRPWISNRGLTVADVDERMRACRERRVEPLLHEIGRVLGGCQ